LSSVSPAAQYDSTGREPQREWVIQPASGWVGPHLCELWEARDLLWLLTWRNIAVRYKQTALGVTWSVLQPTLMMMVFGFVFGRIGRMSSGDLPYPIFVYAGLLPWMFFSAAVTGAAGSVVESERLITKVYFPRLAIPLAAVFAAVVDFAIALSVLIVLMIWYGIAPSWTVALVPLAAILMLLAAVGVGVLLAAFNVWYRDFRYLVGFLMQLWMFATPSIYMDYPPPAAPRTTAMAAVPGDPSATQPRSSLDLGLTDVLRLAVDANPMTGLISFFRAATLGRELPWAVLAKSLPLILLSTVAGVAVFRRVEDSFADVV